MEHPLSHVLAISFPHKKLSQLPITASKTAATALACSPTSQLPTASTHAVSVTASHALDRPLSQLRFVVEHQPMPCRIVDVHCYRIYQRSCMMPLSMHVAIHASSVYVKSRTAYCPDLSSTLIADFVDAAEFHRHYRSHQCCRIPHCLIVSSQHCFVKPWTILAQVSTLVSILLR